CPVVVLGTTEANQAVPRGAGVVSTNIADLLDGVRHYLADQRAAAAAGEVGRAYAAQRFALTRFLADWDDLLERVAAGSPRAGREAGPQRSGRAAAVSAHLAATGSGVG